MSVRDTLIRLIEFSRWFQLFVKNKKKKNFNLMVKCWQLEFIVDLFWNTGQLYNVTCRKSDVLDIHKTEVIPIIIKKRNWTLKEQW